VTHHFFKLANLSEKQPSGLQGEWSQSNSAITPLLAAPLRFVSNSRQPRAKIVIRPKPLKSRLQQVFCGLVSPNHRTHPAAEPSARTGSVIAVPYHGALTATLPIKLRKTVHVDGLRRDQLSETLPDVFDPIGRNRQVQKGLLPAVHLPLDERPLSAITPGLFDHTIALRAFTMTGADENERPLSKPSNKSLHRTDS
jgi:hypothetical protein